MRYRLTPSFFFLSLICFSEIVFAGIYTVDVDVHRFRYASYDLQSMWLDVEEGTPMVKIKTKGGCELEYKKICPECTGYSGIHEWECTHYGRVDSPSFFRGSCYIEEREVCDHQTGIYELPSDAIVYDGKKRLKFIKDGYYLTIARYDRIPWFPFIRRWRWRDNVSVSLSEDYSKVSLTITAE